MNKILKMKVTGTDCTGQGFTDIITFRMVPPTSTDYYGNGYYMTVDMVGGHFYVDVRYSGTTNVEKLAKTWIDNYYGPNAHEVKKVA